MSNLSVKTHPQNRSNITVWRRTFFFVPPGLSFLLGLMGNCFWNVLSFWTALLVKRKKNNICTYKYITAESIFYKLCWASWCLSNECRNIENSLAPSKWLMDFYEDLHFSISCQKYFRNSHFHPRYNHNEKKELFKLIFDKFLVRTGQKKWARPS